MMSQKLATPDLLKIKHFVKKGCDALIFVCDILSLELKHIVDTTISLVIHCYERSCHNQFYKDLTRKVFLKGARGSNSLI